VSDFQIYNIGSGQESTLYYLCSKLVELIKSGSEIAYSSDPAARLSVDISKTKRDLDYEPTNLGNGLLSYIEYITKHKHALPKREI
jgi:nucleoside-diphosphate-sugar epimerase